MSSCNVVFVLSHYLVIWSAFVQHAIIELLAGSLNVCCVLPQVMVHTPSTVRAAELQQLYRGLTLPNLTLDERLDVLLHVKWAVKEYDTPSTREIVELIDREADLLNRWAYCLSQVVPVSYGVCF